MKLITEEEAKEKFGKEFSNITYSETCHSCGCLTSFSGNDSPGSYYCAYCGTLNRVKLEVPNARNMKRNA